MQLSEYQPRLQCIDFDLSQRVLNTYQQSRSKRLENERLKQLKFVDTSYSLAFSGAEEIGKFLYVLGYPLTEIQSYFHESALYLLKLLEWFDTQGPPIKTIIHDDRRGNISETFYKDYSPINSNRCLQGMYLALIAGDIELAKSIARLTLDPPDARYIGPKSEVCTPNQQHLAYAVKNLLLGQPDHCSQELSLLHIDITRTKDQTELICQKEMIEAIVSQQPDGFENSLKILIDWYEKTAPKMIKKKHPDYVDFFMSIPSLGLFALAKTQGLNINEANFSSVYVPLDLVKTS
jgi:hypothetical protein